MASKEQVVTSSYCDGIKSGREAFRVYGVEIAREEVDTLNRTIERFPASSPVGQFLRGERDFWKNQLARAAA